MEIRINVIVEINRSANALAIQTPIPIQLIRRDGQWLAGCDNPAFETISYDTMEEALIAGGEQVAMEMQDTAVEKPHIIGRITPDSFSIQKL